MTTFIFKHASSNKINYSDFNLDHFKYKKERFNKSTLNKNCVEELLKVWCKKSLIGLDITILDRNQTLERVSVENFISDKYKEIHNASLSEFFSTLFVGYTENSMQVAIGLENLNGKEAFLEQYLETPVQLSLEKIIQRKVSRDKLVEIGNLASLSMENAKLMVAFLVFHLSQQKIEWAVCTGTVAVRYVLQQMGLHFHVIDKANPNALGAAQKQWGNYYQQKPFVLAINVADALAVTEEIYNSNF